jgi:hypothetical protein
VPAQVSIVINGASSGEHCNYHAVPAQVSIVITSPAQASKANTEAYSAGY